MSISLKFSYIPYKINKMIILIYNQKNIVNKQDVLFWFMSLVNLIIYIIRNWIQINNNR